MPHEEPYDPNIATDPIRDWYVNTIWGNQIYDDNSLFEVMSLQVFQAGLTWKMILNKRDEFRSAFYNWNIQKVAACGPPEIARLCQNPGIIRNRLKIKATISNSQHFLDIQKEFGSFDSFIWQFTDGKTIINKWETTDDIPV